MHNWYLQQEKAYVLYLRNNQTLMGLAQVAFSLSSISITYKEAVSDQTLKFHFIMHQPIFQGLLLHLAYIYQHSLQRLHLLQHPSKPKPPLFCFFSRCSLF